MELKQRITQMAGLMSISGFEAYNRAALTEQLGDIFDEDARGHRRSSSMPISMRSA